VVAEPDLDLAAGREHRPEAGERRGGRRAGRRSPGLRHGPLAVELERVLVHQEVEGVAVEDHVGPLRRPRRAAAGSTARPAKMS
jgi:hypothetical protein